jgi:glycosyltransferase involved in cell wall biosynthesis
MATNPPRAQALHVGLNLFYLNVRSGGAGTYAAQLIPALLAAEPATRVTAFVSDELPLAMRAQPWSDAVRWVRIPMDPSNGPRGTWALSMAVQWAAIPALAEARGIDVLHGLANVGSLWLPRAARVVTLLDVVWLRYPDVMPPAVLRGMRLQSLASARCSDRVLALSNAARRDILAEVRLDPARVDVVHLGASVRQAAKPTPEAELRRRFELGDALVVLCVSQKSVHKNLAGLITGFAALDGAPMLVLAGRPTPHEDELRALAERLGVAARVRFPPWVSDADLEGLYALAACFSLPTVEEGFGLPVLEAMGRGVPVACSRTSAVGEVAGDAAELFDPHATEDIARALRRVLGDPARRDELVGAGHLRCAQFTWERTGRRTLAAYRRAIADRRSRIARRLRR